MRFTLVLAMLAVAMSARAQVVLGQVDTFQNGTLQGWTGGANPINIPTDGPAGAGDRYLGINSIGGNGPGSRLATFNDTQWSGNFLAAGVSGVEVDFRNEGSTPLELRVVLFLLASPGARYTSTNAFLLAPGSGWQHASFVLDAGNMVLVDGTATYAQTMSNVSRMMFRHNAGAPSAEGTPVVGRLGIDNVRAVPEPATLAGLVAGILALSRSRAKRRR